MDYKELKSQAADSICSITRIETIKDGFDTQVAGYVEAKVRNAFEMEAPKKIYLQENTTTDCYGEFWPEWFEARAKDSDIEYICKDAFIENASAPLTL